MRRYWGIDIDLLRSQGVGVSVIQEAADCEYTMGGINMIGVVWGSTY